MDILLFMKNMECRLHELELTVKSFIKQAEGMEIECQEKPTKHGLTNEQLMNSFNLINDPAEVCKIEVGDECET